ncbi:hypothetical protein FHS38_003039 [Streptomyces netropsis]|uniref:Uncharacterized protein n=1 Tax=Streptomyces netropsis TaxID=55404 RepID=A0A7W7LBJ3_STRNE|nr:hypothetical protein [Streptomyces netropsis]GGR24756.1 hypothetical protein GCM10010219_31930 [Streptomyces netropsis]
MDRTTETRQTACDECFRLTAEMAKARDDRNRSRETDVTVLTRRHLAQCHGPTKDGR